MNRSDLRVEDIALAEVLIDYIKEHKDDELIRTTYEDISNRLKKYKNIMIEPRFLRHYLGQVSSFYHEKGLPFISAIVVNKNGETHTPGTGFYIMLQGYGITDEIMQYKEIKKAQTYRDYEKLLEELYK